MDSPPSTGTFHMARDVVSVSEFESDYIPNPSPESPYNHAVHSLASSPGLFQYTRSKWVVRYILYMWGTTGKKKKKKRNRASRTTLTC